MPVQSLEADGAVVRVINVLNLDLDGQGLGPAREIGAAIVAHAHPESLTVVQLQLRLHSEDVWCHCSGQNRTHAPSLMKAILNSSCMNIGLRTDVSVNGHTCLILAWQCHCRIPMENETCMAIFNSVEGGEEKTSVVRHCGYKNIQDGNSRDGSSLPAYHQVPGPAPGSPAQLRRNALTLTNLTSSTSGLTRLPRTLGPSSFYSN